MGQICSNDLRKAGEEVDNKNQRFTQESHLFVESESFPNDKPRNSNRFSSRITMSAQKPEIIVEDIEESNPFSLNSLIIQNGQEVNLNVSIPS